jgi:hypothetical protein
MPKGAFSVSEVCGQQRVFWGFKDIFQVIVHGESPRATIRTGKWRQFFDRRDYNSMSSVAHSFLGSVGTLIDPC